MLEINPEQSGVWQLRVTITKTATTSPDGRVFIPPFNTGKTYNSQFISEYLPPTQIYRLLRDIHPGGLGKYYSFVHVDWRGEVKRWNA